MPDPSQSFNRATFLKVATYFEGSLVIAAYIIGWLADVNPLANLSLQPEALVWGLAGTAPLYLYFLFSYHLPYSELRAIKRFLVDRMGPLLETCHWSELLYLGLLAGITEETLFRGLLQPLLESHWGWAAGIILSNVLFASAHSITPLLRPIGRSDRRLPWLGPGYRWHPQSVDAHHHSRYLRFSRISSRRSHLPVRTWRGVLIFACWFS